MHRDSQARGADCGRHLGELPAEALDRWVSVMDPFEPIHFIGRAAPAALLLQSARRDQFVPVASAEAWQKAASERQSRNASK